MSEIKADCPCRRKCERHGDCAACREHHRRRKKNCLTTCERLEKKAEGERAGKPN